MTSLLFSILITMLFSALFSGTEISFFSANRVRLELDNQKGGTVPGILKYFYDHSERFISTMLVGNNIALIFYGIFMGKLFGPLIHNHITGSPFLVALLQTILATIIILITGEYLPKSLFKMNPNTMLRTFAIPLYIIYWLLYPVSSFATWLSHSILKLMGVTVKKETNGKLSRVDLDFFVQQSLDHAPEESEQEQELQLFQNALEFRNIKVRDCMIPRNELTAVDVKTPIGRLIKIFTETGFSKIPVYEGDIDNIVGYIHSSELFKGSKKPEILTMPFVPEAMPANRVLKILMEKKRSIAAVVDEFGGTAGIVTMEDLFEEIIGDIEDEHDHNQLVEKQTGENEWEFSGRAEIDRINEKFNLNLPESEDYLTLAGLVLHELQTFPHEGDFVDLHEQKIHMVITKTSATKIELIRVKMEK